MPTADRQLIYTDIQTGRVARIRDYDSLITPAELEEFSWQIIMTNKIPREVFENLTNWEVSQRGWFFTKSPTELSAEHKSRIEFSSKRASCLEQVSKIINFMRFRRTKQVYAHPQVVALYNKEIELYKSTQAVGPLLLSLVDDINDLPVALAEFELTNSQYNDFLISSEIMRNKWNRQLKQASDPESTLASIKQSIGM